MTTAIIQRSLRGTGQIRPRLQTKFPHGFGQVTVSPSAAPAVQNLVDFPVSPLAVMLGDLGYYEQDPISRAWNAELQQAWDDFLADTAAVLAQEGTFATPGQALSVLQASAVAEPGAEMIKLNRDLEGADILVETWTIVGAGDIEEGGQAAVAYVGGVAEMLFTNGYYDGPPVSLLSPSAREALDAWARDKGLPVLGVSIADGAGGDVLYVRITPKSAYHALVEDYLVTLKAVALGTAPGVTVTMVPSPAEAPVTAPAPPPKPPPARRFASVLGWGLLAVGTIAGIGYLAVKGRRR